MKTQAAPNWQSIAKGYYVVANPYEGSSAFARGKNHFTELRHVHAQQVAVHAYYRKLLSRGLRGVDEKIPHLRAHQMDAICRQAEAQFGQMLLGKK